jgi:tetratricopeptide (TPR) repeat protein
MPRPYYYLALALLVGAALLASRMALAIMTPVSVAPNIRSVDELLHYIQQTAGFQLYASWLAVFVGLLSVAFALPGARVPSPKWDKGRLLALVVASPLYVLVVVGIVLLILSTCIRPVQADASFKAAMLYNQDGTWETAVTLYEGVIDLAPKEDFYYIFLGRAQLQYAQSKHRVDLRQSELARALETLERAHALNPLNPDHVANLARFHGQAAELAADPAVQAAHSRAADDYYAQVTALAPQNVMLLNEWAMQRWRSGDEDQACRVLEHSLALDPTFEQTQQLYTDFCPQALPGQPQNLDFED